MYRYCRLRVVLFYAATNLAKDKYFDAIAEPIEKIFWFGGAAGIAFFLVLSDFIIHYMHDQDINRPERPLADFRKWMVEI